MLKLAQAVDQDDGLLRRLPLSGFPTPDRNPGAFLREAEGYAESRSGQLPLLADGVDLGGGHGRHSMYALMNSAALGMQIALPKPW